MVYGSIGIVCVKDTMMKNVLILMLSGIILVSSLSMTAFAASKSDRISVRYVPPKNPIHQKIYVDLKQREVLEGLQEFLSPIRLPEKLRISLAGCDGEPDAFYEDAAITICYEYINELWENMLEETTLDGVAPIDLVIGPLFEVSLHEVAHALFDMLELPVLGREEDAADQVAAYIMLQVGELEARRLIIGTAYAYKTDEERSGPCRPVEDYSSEHSTPAQRGFNLLCIAYGADSKLFADIVSRGYLPEERAEYCEEEYEQVQDAFEILIKPHLDPSLVEKALNNSWLQD